jgi:hypothetical protein
MRKAPFVVWFAGTTFMLAGCATLSKPRDTLVRVNPASVAAAPTQWDGRQVEMVGLLVWDNLALYQDYGTYCRGGERTAIAVDWRKWPGVTRADDRRRVVVRGVFRNGPGNAAPGPGPLEPGQVVRFLSAPAKPCPKALP